MQKKNQITLTIFFVTLLFIPSCNLPGPQLPQATTVPSAAIFVPATDTPFGSSTHETVFTPIHTSVPAQQPSSIATNNPLPALPDFDEVLTFGGAGSEGWGCSEAQYPTVPNTMIVSGSYEYNVFVCVFLQSIDPSKPMKVKVSHLEGEAITLESNLTWLDKNEEAVFWEENLYKGIILNWKPDGSIYFTLALWWPATLPSGSWRMTLYQQGGFQIYEDFQISKASGKAYIDALDPNTRQEVMPGSPWYGNHTLHPNRNGNVDIYGTDYPPNTPVYIVLYNDDKFVHKDVVLSDASGSISAELPGPFIANQNPYASSYTLYGITDPNTTLSGTDFISCYSVLRPVLGAACDYFTIMPDTLPIHPSPVSNPTSCPGAPKQRMLINQRGYVCTQTDSVRLRNSPQKLASTIVQLAKGIQFTVIGGPSCADNWSWWQVRTDSGQIGWVSEGGDNIDPYFICPLP